MLAVHPKTIRRMIKRGELVVHKVGRRNVRVNALSVTHLLTPLGERSPGVGEVRTMVAKPAGTGTRLYRTRGRGKTWTGLIDDEEVKLGTPDRGEAEARLAAIAEKRAKAAAQRRTWRVYKDEKGWFIKFYDDEGKRRTQRIPPSVGATTQSDAEAYARRQFLNEVKLEPTAATPERPTPDTTFRQFGELWTNGTLAKLEPDYIAPKASSEDDRQRLELYLYPELGDLPMKHFQGKEGLALVKRVQREVAQTELAKSTRRQILQNANRLLNLAVHPFELIEANPLPRGFLPKADSGHAKEFVYPSEDAALMRCRTVPEVERLFYGVLIREGLRVSEALDLTWSVLDLEHGVISLDENKTDDPRDWSLDPGVCRALRVWKSLAPKARGAGAKVFVKPDGRVLDRYEAAARLRDCLREAGVTREQLFVRSDTRLALRAHDLRASFVTVSLANGRSEAWVTDRTGHKSSAMVYRYKRGVRLCQELKLGPFLPLDEAIPELAAEAAKAAKRMAGDE